MYRTLHTISYFPLYMQFPSFRNLPMLSFVACSLIAFFLLCTGLSFNCSLLLSAGPIFCLGYHLITVRCFSSSAIHLLGSHVDFSSQHTINRTLHFKVSIAVPSWQSTKPKQRNLVLGLFRWCGIRLNVLGTSLFHNTSSNWLLINHYHLINYIL